MSRLSGDALKEYAEKCRESKKTGNYDWLNVVPYDSRFPNTNQTGNCRENFIDYFRCKNLYGEDYKPCNYFHKMYRVICPKFWYEEWEAQVADGTYPYRERFSK
ncbi:hypothetical protein CRM22_010795 [Opisthorchis felineus]|uniref:Cytochrome c oxidase subunit n=2 Tax=Opisthorchis felineus TaxID=147828 RepID=A0A4S2KR55_OPIFE|nr:hypothetical protein CRM22_010795 [Opisthorchis felineus]